MDIKKEIEILVDTSARARLLSAQSSNEKVVENMQAVKKLCEDSAMELGYSRGRFNMMTVNNYMLLIK